MAMNSRNQGSRLESMELQSCSVTQLAMELIDAQKSHVERRGIRIEMDVQPIRALVDIELIKKALAGLIVNAIESTPEGGEITIISIDGIHQWEIEVADSSHSRHQNEFTDFAIFEAGRELDADGNNSPAEDLPRLLPFPRSDHLRDAYRSAFKHDGQIQCWECPQGGMAYVLVIPRRRISKAA